MADVTWIDKDNGFKALRAAVRGASGTIQIGVNENLHLNADGTYDLTNAELGAIHEYGTEHVPQRSFLRAWVDERQDEIKAKVAYSLRSTLEYGAPWAEVMGDFGKWAVEQVRQRIKNGLEPANAESTLKRKGSDKPLIDSGQLLAAIEYELHPKVLASKV